MDMPGTCPTLLMQPLETSDQKQAGRPEMASPAEMCIAQDPYFQILLIIYHSGTSRIRSSLHLHIDHICRKQHQQCGSGTDHGIAQQIIRITGAHGIRSPHARPALAGTVFLASGNRAGRRRCFFISGTAASRTLIPAAASRTLISGSTAAVPVVRNSGTAAAFISRILFIGSAA